MSDKIPEVQELKSWEDAFQFPVPATRRIEQQLRAELAANGDKLRRLVGSALTALCFALTTLTWPL